MSARPQSRPQAPCIQPGEDYKPPSRAELPVDSLIQFYHPGYEAPFNLLFSLPCVEKTSSSSDGSVRWGVHYATALTTCQIIANNAFDGYLAEQADGDPLDEAPDSILLRAEYYFVVPSATDHPYPVVPSFQEWRFPGTAQIPQVWKDTVYKVTNPAWGDRSGGQCCVVTGRFMVESAHLVPNEDQEWFSQNVMGQYDPHSSNNINCINNKILLDCSLHRTMDKRIWAFAPRHGRFAVQTISIPEPLTYNHLCEFVHEYHGRHMAIQGRLEFLFARFAWAVLYLVKTFVFMPWHTTLLARYRLWEDDGRTRQKVESLGTKQIDSLFGGGGTRSASPRATRSSNSRKRSRPTSEQGTGAGESRGLGWVDPDLNKSCQSSGNLFDYELAWPREPGLNDDWPENEATFRDEVRGRRRTREEDDLRYGKRQRLGTSKSSPLGPVPSLVDTGSCSSEPATPGPGAEEGGIKDTRHTHTLLACVSADKREAQ